MFISKPRKSSAGPIFPHLFSCAHLHSVQLNQEFVNMFPFYCAIQVLYCGLEQKKLSIINCFSCKQWISVLISVCILHQGMLEVPEHILNSNEVSLPTWEAPAFTGVWHRVFVSWESNKGNHNLSCSSFYCSRFCLCFYFLIFNFFHVFSM